MPIYNKFLNLEDHNLNYNRKTIKICKIQIKVNYLCKLMNNKDIWIISKYLDASAEEIC